MKAKRSESYTRYFMTRFLTVIEIGIGIPLIIGICGVLSFGLFAYGYMSVGEIRTSIDPALLPTAEYLYEHPQQPPDIIEFDPLRHSPASLCHRSKITFWTQIFLNGARVPPNAFYLINSNGEGIQSIWGQFCLNDRFLPLGLHLVEMHWRQNLLDEPIIYRWAVKVNEK